MNQTTWQRALVGADRTIYTDRGAAPAGHAPEPDEVPFMAPRGRLTFRRHTVFLSERDALIASVFLYYFGTEVGDLELLDRVWPEGATRRTLRHRLHRLERRFARVGLELVEVSDHAHALRDAAVA
ncbi:MAG: hypothetical protein QOI08_1967 [Actinomycetota bacterium]|jgi:hypothetical protein|nr:hypothetical protein [Actinomycetota bacterium]